MYSQLTAKPSQHSGEHASLRSQLLIGSVLALVMLLTRSHHFGTAVSLPDASLAVFFLAGMWITSSVMSVWLFAGLLAIAGLADQMAFASNVSSWCVTAAYGFLVPAYGVMWLAGKFCRQTNIQSMKGIALTAAMVFIGTAIYFAISNGSFFWFSGYFSNLSFVEYWSRTLKYFPWYLMWASVYVAAGCALSLTRRVFARSSISAH
jgi:hypothetical protein